MSKKCLYTREARKKCPIWCFSNRFSTKNSHFFKKTNCKSSKLQGFWKKLKALGKNSSLWGKNSSFLASKLNEPVVTNYTRYHKSVEKKACTNGKSYHGGLFWQNFSLRHDCMCLCLTPYNLMYVKGHVMSHFESLHCIKLFHIDKLMTQKILPLNMKVCPIDDGKPGCIYTTKIFFHQYFGVGMETSLLAFYTYYIDRPEYWLLNASIEAWKPHTSQDYECKIKNDVSGSGTRIYRRKS